MRSLARAYHFLQAILAVILFGYPARKLKVIGVTGTDGKTTTTTLLYSIFKTAKKRVAMISTVEAKIGKTKIDTGPHTTTPNPFLLQRLLRKMVNNGINIAVLETTSHGIDQFRIWGCNFYVAILTNISHEHTDYHGTFKNYLNTKAKLFKMAKISVLNRLDPPSQKVYRMVSRYNNKTIWYPTKQTQQVESAIARRFPEPYNRLNAQAAIAAVKLFGITNKDMAKGIKTFPGIPGRMQEVKNKKGIKIFIDFAHTPNALKSVLSVLKNQVTKGKKLIAVFGCAGKRDVQKRPKMAKISTEIADLSVFTSEDPRTEDIDRIIKQMIDGITKRGAKYFKIIDREAAVNFALNRLASRGDVVVICGKGHEKSMAIGSIEHPWSDLEAVKRALK